MRPTPYHRIQLVATSGHQIAVGWLMGRVRVSREILGLWAATTAGKSADVASLLGGGIEDPLASLPESRVITQPFRIWRRQRSSVVPFSEASLWDDGAMSVLGRQWWMFCDDWGSLLGQWPPPLSLPRMHPPIVALHGQWGCRILRRTCHEWSVVLGFFPLVIVSAASV